MRGKSVRGSMANMAPPDSADRPEDRRNLFTLTLTLTLVLLVTVTTTLTATTTVKYVLLYETMTTI